jgi:hypothetical protein
MQATCIPLVDCRLKHWYNKIRCNIGPLGKSLEIVLNKILHYTRKLFCYSFVMPIKGIDVIASRFKNVGSLAQ